MGQNQLELDEALERLRLIETTCDELLRHLDDRTYNLGPEHVRSDISYLRACADPKPA